MSRRDELLAFADTVKGFMPKDEGLALHRFALEHATTSHYERTITNEGATRGVVSFGRS